ncbi:MAG: M56 family metallopeptidase [Verrucomicrobiota bacterium]
MNPLSNMVDPWLQNLALLSCKGALMALALGAVLLLLRRHVSPAWRHGLWLLVLLRFALPDIGTSPLSLNQVAELPAVQLISESSPVPAYDAEAAGESITSPHTLAPAVPVATIRTEAPAPNVIDKAEAPAPSWTWMQWLLVIWMSGVGSVLTVMLMLHLRLVARLRRDASPAPPGITCVLNEACILAGISRLPRLMVTDAIRSPALFGVLSPAILLPREMVHENDPAALKLVFLHELAHLRRQDLWAQIVTSIIIALHWFNPVVWWAARRMRAEAEMAADARALACTDSAEVHRFGTVLLGFASRATSGWMLWLAAATVLGISESKHDLRRRIEALKDIARGRRTRWIIGLSAFLLLAVSGLSKAPAQTDSSSVQTKSLPAPASNMLTISGIVVDEAGKAVAGARCSLSLQDNFEFSSLSEMSDTEGRFKFERVPLATSALSLSASHKDFATSERTDFNGNSLAKEHRIVLPSFTWVTGRVTDKRDGKPIKDARVFYGREFFGSYRWFFPSVRTSETGEYRLRIKTSDTKDLIIRAWAQDMTSQSTLMDIEKRGAVYNAALEPVERIPGKLVNAEGQPVKGGLVWVIEDRFVLDERKEPFTAEWLTSKDKRRNLAEGKTFVCLSYSGEGGAFKLQDVDPMLKGRQWVAAIHPEEGIAFFPAKDLASGMIVKLHRWASFTGLVRQSDGSILKSKEIELTAGVVATDSTSSLPPALSHYLPSRTDAEGSCRVQRILPNCSLVGLKVVGGEFRGVDPLKIGEGSVTARTIKQRASLRPVATPDARIVRGRIVLPEGRPFTSSDYSIVTTLVPADGRFTGAMPRPDAGGRFVESLSPDTYNLSVTIFSRKPGMSMAPKSQRHLSFRIEPDAEAKPYDLVDIVLEEADFAFEPRAARAFEISAAGGMMKGENGRVEILAADHDQKPLPKVRVEVMDLVDQGRQALGVQEIAGGIPAVITDDQGRASLTFPRVSAHGERAAGVLVRATARDGGVSRESSAMDGMRTRVSVGNQLPLEVQVTPAITSWMLPSWMEPSQEMPAVGGTRLSGFLQLSHNSGFLIRGRLADGSSVFSEAQRVSHREKVFKKSITMAPGVTLEGQIRAAKVGQNLQGWIAAHVIVQAEAELGQVNRGFPTIGSWYAWAPVRRDGTFVLQDLPRGRISLFAMGEGWQVGQYGAKPNPATDSAKLTLGLDAQTSGEQALKILLPDGTAAADATVSRSSLSSYGILPTSMVTNVSHVVAAEHLAQYAEFKKAGIPGLRNKTNAQGEVTMTHLPAGNTSFDVYWRDAKTQQPCRARCEVTVSADEAQRQTVTVKDVHP